MESSSKKKQADDFKNPNSSKDPQSSSLNNNLPVNGQTHRHSKIEKAILTFQLDSIYIKLPHLNSFIVDLQIDDSKLIFSPKATTEENNFFIGYNLQKIITARINNSHSRAKARKIYISISAFNKDKKKIAYGKIEIHPGSFYGEEKLKLRPISIDLNTIQPCPIFFFGLQLNDIPIETSNTDDEKNSEIVDRDIQIPQLQNFEPPETLISTKQRTARRNSDAELMTEEEKEKIQQQNENKNDENEDLNQDENEEEIDNDDEFFVINNPDLIAMIEEEERKKQEEIKRKQEEEIKRKKQEEERKKQEEERKRQEEIKRKQEEERRKQEELKRKQEEEIRRKQEEERKKQEEIKRRKEEELKKKIEGSKKRQLEGLMQKSLVSNNSNIATKLKNKIKNKKNFVSSLSKNSNLLKNTLDAIKESLPNKSNKDFKKYRRSFSTNPKKLSLPSLIFPLKISENFSFSYSYRWPTDENGNLIEDAPFDPKNVELDKITIFSKSKKSAFKSINIKSKTTNDAIDYKKWIQTKKVCDEVLNNISDENKKHEIKIIVENAISSSNPYSVERAQDLLPLIIQDHNKINNYFYQQSNSQNQNIPKDIDDSKQNKPTFLSDSFISNSYNSYRNDTNRQALFLLSNESNNSSNSSSIIAINDFAIDEICAKQGDVDNDENGQFRTRYERLQRQSKIKFILAKIRRYNLENRPQKLEVENLIYHEWTVHASSDEDDLYEYYDYE